MNSPLWFTMKWTTRNISDSPWCAPKALAAGEVSPILKKPCGDFEPRVGAPGSSASVPEFSRWTNSWCTGIDVGLRISNPHSEVFDGRMLGDRQKATGVRDVVTSGRKHGPGLGPVRIGKHGTKLQDQWCDSVHARHVFILVSAFGPCHFAFRLNFYTGKGRMNWHKDDYNFVGRLSLAARHEAKNTIDIKT